jgi:hypothetical protein
MILVNWFDVYVQKDDPEEGADPDSGFHRGDTFPKVFDCLEKLDTALDGHWLPTLDKWEPNAEEPGLFHMSKNEDDQGNEITDEEYRADPARGLFLVDYTISVSVAETRPLTKGDIQKMMTPETDKL